MAVQLDKVLDSALMAISAMAAGVSPASPPAPAPPPERGDSFRGALRAEEARNGMPQPGGSGRGTAQTPAEETPGNGTEIQTTEDGNAAAGKAPAGAETGPANGKEGANSRAEGSARFQAVFQNGLQAEALDLKGVLVSRATEARAPVIGLQAEQIALEKLGGDRARPANEPATIRLPQPPEREAPLFKPVAGGDRKPDPQADGAPGRDASTASAPHNPQGEPRVESTASDRPPHEAKLLPHPIPLTVVDAPLRAAAPVQAPPASSASAQLQEIRDKVLARIESGVQVLLDRGEGRMTLRLQPPELGKVLVEVQPGDRGMEIKLSTENLAVREVVLGGLEQLKSNLQAAGLEVNTLSVEVNGFRDPFTRSQAGDGDGRRRGGAGGGGGEGGGADAADSAAAALPVSLYIGRRVNLLA